jgi:hypothetical protein
VIVDRVSAGVDAEPDQLLAQLHDLVLERSLTVRPFTTTALTT